MPTSDPDVVKRIERVLARTFGGLHHCPWWSKRKACGQGYSITIPVPLATYDGSELTRLVVAAHDEAVRVEITGASSRYLRLFLHPRARRHPVSDFWTWPTVETHPTIERAIEFVRGTHD